MELGKEYKLSEEEFQRIVAYAKNHYGIELGQKRIIVEGRLKNYLAVHGFDSYEEYINAVIADERGTEARSLVNLLTTNHTFFMREFEHFEFMREVVLPQLRRKEERTKDLRVWCAAASSGEEPYTIAMVLMDFFGLEHHEWDTTVLATDISTNVLEKALKGIYADEQLVNLPESWRKRYFKQYSAGYSIVKENLKEQVLFRQFNLMEPLPFRRKLHVVFLRNVMIYFDEDTKHELVDRIYDFMEPGGYLFIGTTETLDKSRTRFQYVRPSIYRKP